MWSFLRKRKATQNTKEKRQQPKSLEQLIANIGDFTDLAEHDAALKFWLPEPAKCALEEISQSTGHSISGFLRQFLVIHCYGLYPYILMLDAMPNFCSKHDTDNDPMFSIRDNIPKGKIRVSTYWVADLGKNVAPIKVWVPTRVKQDLSILAEHASLTTSNYIREIIISRVLGHGMLPKRPEMMALPTQDADNWVEEKQLLWTEVDKQGYETYPIREIRYKWEDDPDYSAD